MTPLPLNDQMLFVLGLSLLIPRVPDPPPTGPPQELRNARDLYNAYRWYGLPLPPRNAKPVQWNSERIVTGGGSDGPFIRVEPDYDFGWLIAAATATRSACAQYPGSEYLHYDHRADIFEPFSIATFKKYTEDRHWTDSFWIDLAAGLWHLNGQAAANSVYERWLALERYDDDGKRIRSPVDALQALRWQAWHYWEGKIYDADVPWLTIYSKLHRIANEDTSPKLDIKQKFDSQDELLLTVKPGRGRPGTAEELIDRLVNVKRQGFFSDGPKYYYDDPGGLRVFDLDSVPYLIAHIDDHRMTRDIVRPAVSLMHESVSGTCRTILVDLSRSELDWNRLGDGTPEERMKYVAETWYDKAKAMGEEKWCVSARHANGWWAPSQTQLAILRAKYPARLTGLLNESMQEHRSYATQAILEHIFRSRLPDAEKDAALQRVLNRPGLEAQRIGLTMLHTYRPARFKTELLRSLGEIAANECYWRLYDYSVATEYLQYCQTLNDADVWDAFSKTLPIMEPTFRTYVYERLFDRCTSEGVRPETMRVPLRLLRAALEDSQKCVRPEYNSHSWPCFEYPKMTVQNCAAMKLAWIFNRSVPYKPNRTESEWAVLRESLTVLLDERLKLLAAYSP